MKEKKAYPQRSKGTTKPFPDLNREALAYVLDAVEKKYQDQRKDENDPEFEKLLQGENFPKLYAWAIEKVTPANPEQLIATKGSWVKYNQGSDHMPLVQSLQGHGTGWCTAGESTAEIQLKGGDFYVYYSFDKKFIYDSYSCRNDKGTHKAINRFRDVARKVSRNNTKTAWVLKGDIRKFFASINHQILKDTLKNCIIDEDTLWLLGQIIDSFHSGSNLNVGLPLGNVTSQLFINVYMNEFDQFMKQKLKIRYYLRYCDDFVILDGDRIYLENLIPKLATYLENRLNLSLHPGKVSIKTLASGVDFLGWVHFPHHRVLRTATKRRIFKQLKQKYTKESVASYSGLMKHGNTYKLIKRKGD